MARYDVVVGNIGTVYSGTSEREANLTFETYVDRSESGVGRCAGESVTLFAGDEITREHVPAETFPEDTATVFDPQGFPHVGHLTGYRDDRRALYHFPGDFIAGDGTEAYLDPYTASDAESLAEYLSCDGFEWTAERPEELS